MFVLWGWRRQLLYNEAYGAILGERHPAAFGQPMLQVWAEIADSLEPLVERAYSGESIYMDDILLAIVRNGVPQEAHFSFSYTPIHGDKAGDVIGVFCACAETTGAFYRDVTALATAATALQHSNDRFGAAMQAVGVMWTNNSDGLMIGAQPGWAGLTGQSQAEYGGFGWAAAVHPDDAQPTIAAWTDAVVERRLFNFEHRVRRRDGVWRRFSVRAVPVVERDGSLREWVGVHIDITDATLAADALRVADRRKDKFLAMLAHELRNPLAPIRTAAELLARPDLPPDRVGWAAGVIARQSHTMTLLLDELLDLSRLRSGKIVLNPERVEVASLIESAVETVRHLLDTKGHDLDVQLPDSPLILEVDRLRTTQVLINLLTNAAKYTDPGGQLRIEAAAMDGHVRVQVIDNGVGLAPDSLAEIFEMFAQPRGASDRSDRSLGIGLILASRLVELQSGHMEVFSKGLGQGSTFRVTLPLVAPRRTSGSRVD